MARVDLCGAVRDAHHDLTRILVTMNGLTTSGDQLLARLESLQLMIRIHAGAEARVYEVMLDTIPGDDLLAPLADTTQDEHLDHMAAADALASGRPGSLAWHEQIRELQSRMLQHAASSERRLATLQHRMPALAARMAREYALASMRILTVTESVHTLHPRRMRASRRTLPLPLPRPAGPVISAS